MIGQERDEEALRADERRRVGRDLHDELGGDLAAIKMALAVLAHQLPQDAGVHEQAAYVDTLVDAAIASMHRFSAGQQGSAAGIDACQATLRALTEAFERQSGIACSLSVQGADVALAVEVARGLPSMLKECLANVGKHARAGRVLVRLARTHSTLSLEVEDDGIGCVPANLNQVQFAHQGGSEHGGYGIRGMQERTEELGGAFSIHAVQPHGTLIRIELPMKT